MGSIWKHTSCHVHSLSDVNGYLYNWNWTILEFQPLKVKHLERSHQFCQPVGQNNYSARLIMDILCRSIVLHGLFICLPAKLASKCQAGFFKQIIKPQPLHPKQRLSLILFWETRPSIRLMGWSIFNTWIGKGKQDCRHMSVLGVIGQAYRYMIELVCTYMYKIQL